MVWLLAALLAQADPSIDALVYLARHAERRDCGCAPPKPGDPGRIVVAFFACGYSHLSQDTFAGMNFGNVLRRLLPEIVAARREDGLFFPDDPAANAWMAYALTETFAATGDLRYQAPARRAAEAIQGMPATDPDALFWQSVALRSASIEKLVPKPDPLPSVPEGGTSLEIVKMDHRSVLSRGHSAKEHRERRTRLLETWPKLQLKEGCGAGSWNRSVEATSYLSTALGRYCWACKTFGGLGEKD